MILLITYLMEKYSLLILYNFINRLIKLSIIIQSDNHYLINFNYKHIIL